MRATQTQTAVALVLLGKFKPADFELPRLVEQKVLPTNDLEAACYEVLVPGQAVVLSLPWGKLSVVEQKLMVEISQVPYVRGQDLVSKTMQELSPLSTIVKFGINVVSHYRFPSMADRDVFASKLVPTSGWGEFGERVSSSFALSGNKHGGLAIVTLREANLVDRSAGWIDATVQPSTLIPDGCGVAISINDHFELSADEMERYRSMERAISEDLLGLLQRSFDNSLQRSFDISDGLLSEV